MIEHLKALKREGRRKGKTRIEILNGRRDTWTSANRNYRRIAEQFAIDLGTDR
jgi:hypothetical protein